MRKQSFKLFVMSFLFVIIGFFSNQSAAAQSGSLSVEIPFNFHVGNERLAAGKYEIQRLKNNIFMLRNKDGQVQVLAQTPVTIQDTNSADTEKVVFNRYGNQYFLRQIFATRATAGRGLYESKAEKNARKGVGNELEAKNAKPQQIAVAVKK